MPDLPVPTPRPTPPLDPSAPVAQPSPSEPPYEGLLGGAEAAYRRPPTFTDRFTDWLMESGVTLALGSMGPGGGMVRRFVPVKGTINSLAKAWKALEMDVPLPKGAVGTVGHGRKGTKVYKYAPGKSPLGRAVESIRDRLARAAGGEEYVWPQAEARYRELAVRYHPDHGGDPKDMVRITQARDLIKKHFAPRVPATAEDIADAKIKEQALAKARSAERTHHHTGKGMKKADRPFERFKRALEEGGFMTPLLLAQALGEQLSRPSPSAEPQLRAQRSPLAQWTRERVLGQVGEGVGEGVTPGMIPMGPGGMQGGLSSQVRSSLERTAQRMPGQPYYHRVVPTKDLPRTADEYWAKVRQMPSELPTTDYTGAYRGVVEPVSIPPTPPATHPAVDRPIAHLNYDLLRTIEAALGRSSSQ